MSVPPHPPPQQPPQPQPPHHQPPPGFLQLTLQGSTMTSSWVAPAVRLNGYPVPTSYGLNTLPLPPGRWRVEVDVQWLWRYGRAALDVDVHPHQSVPVFYAAPVLTFLDGSIGHEKQSRKGLVPLLVVAGLALALVALMIVLVVSL